MTHVVSASRPVLAPAAAVLAAVCLGPPREAAGITRAEILARAVTASDRVAELRRPGRGWEDAPYLVGTLRVYEELERDAPGSARRLFTRVAEAVGRGSASISNGDDCGYSQAALDLFRLAGDSRDAYLRASDGPLDFDRWAVRADADSSPPRRPWWLAGGYGPRYWQDDFFTHVPGLAMRGAASGGMPGDTLAKDLAYEWIEAYLYDHRKALGAEADAPVPTLPDRRRAGWTRGDASTGRLLYDARTGLVWHDVERVGDDGFWSRGNGWVAFGLVRAQRFLDRPYTGGRFTRVVDRTGVRELLSRMAATLAASRNAWGTWNADLVRRDAYREPETSGTGLFTFMLARGIHEGWLDRDVYAPVVLNAFRTLLLYVDALGDVHDIQDVGTGPDGPLRVSSDPRSNLSFGVGAFLLAAAEVARFPAADLARLESVEVVNDGVPRARSYHLPVLDVHGMDVHACNPGRVVVSASLEARDAGGRVLGTASPFDLDAGACTVLEDAARGVTDVPGVVVLRASGDLIVLGCGDGAIPSRDSRVEPRRAGPRARAGTSWALDARELYEAVVHGDEKRQSLQAGGGGVFRPVLVNASPLATSVRVTVRDAGGRALREDVVALPPFGGWRLPDEAPGSADGGAFADVENLVPGTGVLAYATSRSGGVAVAEPDLIEPGEAAWLIGLDRRDAMGRARVSLVNASAEAIAPVVELHAPSGDVLRSLTIPLRPFEHHAMLRVDTRAAYAVVRLPPREGRLLAYTVSGQAVRYAVRERGRY